MIPAATTDPTESCSSEKSLLGPKNCVCRFRSKRTGRVTPLAGSGFVRGGTENSELGRWCSLKGMELEGLTPGVVRIMPWSTTVCTSDVSLSRLCSICDMRSWRPESEAAVATESSSVSTGAGKSQSSLEGDQHVMPDGSGGRCLIARLGERTAGRCSAGRPSGPP